MSSDKSKAENIEDVRNKLKNHDLRLVNMWFNVQASNVALGALRITLYDLEKKFHQFKRETKMTKLTTKARKKLKPKEFALPKSRKFPVPDKSHAKNAKARASEMEHKGKISKATEEKIDAKANKVLKGKKKK